jgi:uncharacterized membrane protein YgdD (TMEM256/DUF423 family)
MNNLQFRLLGVGCALMGMALLIGAFGETMLDGYISPQDYDIFKQAVQYHRLYAISLLLMVPLVKKLRSTQIKIVTWFFGIGIFIICTCLYLLALSETLIEDRMGWLRTITPLGSFILILGWAYLSFIGWSNVKPEAHTKE